MKTRNERRAEKWQAVQRYKAIIGCETDGCDMREPVALQFDHIGGDKLGNVSDLIASDYGMKRIMAEIAKCRVLCANHHALVTHARKGG